MKKTLVILTATFNALLAGCSVEPVDPALMAPQPVDVVDPVEPVDPVVTNPPVTDTLTVFLRNIMLNEMDTGFRDLSFEMLPADYSPIWNPNTDMLGGFMSNNALATHEMTIVRDAATVPTSSLDTGTGFFMNNFVNPSYAAALNYSNTPVGVTGYLQRKDGAPVAYSVIVNPATGVGTDTLKARVVKFNAAAGFRTYHAGATNILLDGTTATTPLTLDPNGKKLAQQNRVFTFN